MKIALFGASGKTGQEVVKQALKKGYEINAFVRDPKKLQIANPKLKLFVGDVLKLETFGEVISEVDAVVITLGGIMAEGIKNIISGMKVKNIRRIILMSSYPMSGTPEGMNYLKAAGMESRFSEFMPVINDKKAQEKMVIQSGLIWTIIRPTFLKDESKSGEYSIYHTETTQFDPSKNSTARADVADFIIRLLDSSEGNNKLVLISS